MPFISINHKLLGLVPMLFILAACVSTQVMPVAKNAVQINTRASGLLFKGKAVPETMRVAAKETLARGYTHFKFSDVSSGQGSEVYGASSYGGGNINGNTYRNSFSATYNDYNNTFINRRPTEAAAVTVIMFHDNEPGAQGAFDAGQILAQYQGQ